MKKQSKKQSLPNAVGTNIPDTAVATVPKPNLRPLVLHATAIAFSPVEGLALVQRGDDAVSHELMAKYPLAVTPSGRHNGRLMNFGGWLYQTRGQAVNQKHAEALKGEFSLPTLPPIISQTDKKLASEAFDKLRTVYMADCKTLTTLIHSRPDVEVTAAGFKRTSTGYTFNTSARLVLAKVDSSAALKAQLAEQAEVIKQLKAHVPKKTAERILKGHHPIVDIPSAAQPVVGGQRSITPAPANAEATAPVPQGEPVAA